MVGTDDGDRRQHRARTRHEEQAETEPEHQSPSSGVLAAPGQPNEGTPKDVPDRGDNQTEGHHAQYRQADVSEEVLRKPQQAEKGCPDEGESAKLTTRPPTTASGRPRW
jgi:hypothetical protein